ncbi:H-NS histone family protein [Roseomonas sp. NAR14]|uniref:H-NS histone family protein n=1 Tax=Roseomonas acroporae TaxID=2937791 RepID=A0A9X1YBC0_9PROT|nr:H-NS histone family protein [Roseomonas acroporae]MCK8787284.1 H-NS histone family protein [Roseomonas acroporae]
MQLTPEQVAALLTLGFHLFPASPDHVARLTMQRRIFHVAGEPRLVTRNGLYYETQGTLLSALAKAEPVALDATRMPPAAMPQTPAGDAPAAPPSPALADASLPAGPRTEARMEARMEPGAGEAAVDAAPTPPEARAPDREEARIALLDELRGKAAALGLPIEELHPQRRADTARRACPPPACPPPETRGTAATAGAKYRGPNGETWSGRGRRPQWLVTLLAADRTLDEFRA